MKIILEPLSGTAKANLERAKIEVARVLGFRGSVTNTKAEGTRIVVDFEVNPKWELPMKEKLEYLGAWIPTKVKTIFTVREVCPEDTSRRTG